MTKNNSPKKPEPVFSRKPTTSLEVVYRPVGVDGCRWVYVFENRHDQTVNRDKVARIWRESMG